MAINKKNPIIIRHAKELIYLLVILVHTCSTIAMLQADVKKGLQFYVRRMLTFSFFENLKINGEQCR